MRQRVEKDLNFEDCFVTMTIVRDKDIRSGKPIVKGTRVAVGDIVARFYKLGRSTEEVATDLDVEGSDVEDALRYYHDTVLDREDVGIEA